MSPTDKSTSDISGSRIKSHPCLALFKEHHWQYIRRRYYISSRELEVARLICRGLNNDQIAELLKIKHGTVKTHIRNIYRRIYVNNKIELLLKFIEDAMLFSNENGGSFSDPPR